MRISVNGTPVPSKEVELKSSGSGPIKTYKLSPEEMERELEKFRPKSEEESKVATKLKIKRPPNKIEFLKIVASGKSMNRAAKDLGLSSGNLYYWLNKWDLKGIKPDRAKVLLDELDNNGENLLREENSPSRESAETETTKKKLVEAEEEIKRLRNELKQTQEALNVENVAHKAAAEQVRELELDLLNALATNNKAVTDHNVDHDPVNHPSHYTAGKVECIEAIESATTGLDGGQAYATGAAIKYLWRWRRKGGAEDLRKARWYIDRLIKEVEKVEAAAHC